MKDFYEAYSEMNKKGRRLTQKLVSIIILMMIVITILGLVHLAHCMTFPK